MITEQKLEAVYQASQDAINEHGGSEPERAQLQWLLNVRLIAELCQHGTRAEAKEITDALYTSLVEVCFRDQQ